jgi:hypothetical protein
VTTSIPVLSSGVRIKMAPWALAAALVAGCTSAAPQASKPKPTPAAEPETPPEDAPTMEPNYEPTYQDPVEVTGIYTVSPVRGGKRLQAGYLLVDGKDETWVVSYRPDPKLFEYIDKRVVVRGRPYTNSPYVQSVGGTHFELQSIELAPGETPYDPKPKTLPAPPRATDEAELRARVGRWVHVVGTLQLPPTDEGEMWPTGTLELDGQELAVQARGLEERVRPFEGKQVTVLAHVTEDDGKLELDIGKVCAGVVAECEVDRDSDD